MPRTIIRVGDTPVGNWIDPDPPLKPAGWQAAVDAYTAANGAHEASVCATLPQGDAALLAAKNEAWRAFLAVCRPWSDSLRNAQQGREAQA